MRSISSHTDGCYSLWNERILKIKRFHTDKITLLYYIAILGECKNIYSEDICHAFENVRDYVIVVKQNNNVAYLR